MRVRVRVRVRELGRGVRLVDQLEEGRVAHQGLEGAGAGHVERDAQHVQPVALEGLTWLGLGLGLGLGLALGLGLGLG